LLASITIKVTLDQQEELLEKSKHQKISVSEVIRRLIFEPPADGDASGTETPPSELEKKITQMQYILADMKTLAKEAKK
jgi:predicted CopG family antitoxin